MCGATGWRASWSAPAAGLLLAVWPTIALLLTVAFVVPAVLSRARSEAVSGFLVGLPAAWLAMIGQAAARCAAFDAQPGQECYWPDVTGWVPRRSACSQAAASQRQSWSDGGEPGDAPGQRGATEAIAASTAMKRGFAGSTTTSHESIRSEPAPIVNV